MKLSPILLLAWLLLALLPAQAQTLLRTLNGGPDERFASAVIDAGDQNGDGYGDLLVGAPGYNGGQGAVYCVSGAYLALGSGPITLWSVAPASNPPARFGTSLASSPSLIGNSTTDFIVGAPDHGNYKGALFAIDGTTKTLRPYYVHGNLTSQLGRAIVLVGDVNDDGRPDFAAIARSHLGGPSAAEGVYVVSGNQLGLPPGNGSLWNPLVSGVAGFGTSLAAVDLDGDLKLDVVIGSPLETVGGAAEAGRVHVFSLYKKTTLATYSASSAGEHLGQSVDASQDYDGDGRVDLVAGAPDWAGPGGNQTGRAVVLSGAKLLANTTPKEIFVLNAGSGNATPGAGWRFGAAVRSIGDLNKDGVGDLLVGMPNYFTQVPIGPGKGGVVVFSGATGMRLGGLSGAKNEYLGDVLLGKVGDLDGDGFSEFVVAGSQADAPFTDGGVLKCYRLFPSFPGTYCTSKINSQGCTPQMASSGLASANSTAAAFVVSCSNIVNKQNGLMIYSHTPGTKAFQGGFLCIQSPLRRIAPQNSGGSSTGADCSGTLAFDFTPWILSGGDVSLVAGAEVFCQYWSRDPQSASGTNMSNALRFVINP